MSSIETAVRAGRLLDLEVDGLALRHGLASDVRFAQGAATLRIDGQPAMIRSAVPILVRSGEEVSVVGVMKNGVLNALVYENRSSGTKGSLGSTLLFSVVGGVFMAAPVLMLSAMVVDIHRRSDLLAALSFGLPFGSIFFILGFYVFYQGVLVRRAQRLLEESRFQPVE